MTLVCVSRVQIDLFCQVIDNYGDIGVCWRLARQLVAEHGCEVRLIVDDLGAFRVIAPEINPGLARQSLLGIEIVAWSVADTLLPFAVVIEAFACNPPTSYVAAMAARRPKPVWINLEYLSAEAWVDEIHGMPSQHQRLPLKIYFFCPGCTEASGGLIRERVLNADAPTNRTTALRIFVFAYPHAPVDALVTAFDAAGVISTVTLAAPIGDTNPDWKIAPRVAQTQFDALLATFDFLIVRGEDSFLRAQWAAKPFLWHIYPTEDGAHLIKLDAWLDHYCVGLEGSVSEAYRAASHAANAAKSDATQSAAIELLAQNIHALAAHSVVWRTTLMRQTDLAMRLVEFVAEHKGNNLG